MPIFLPSYPTAELSFGRRHVTFKWCRLRTRCARTIRGARRACHAGRWVHAVGDGDVCDTGSQLDSQATRHGRRPPAMRPVRSPLPISRVLKRDCVMPVRTAHTVNRPHARPSMYNRHSERADNLDRHKLWPTAYLRSYRCAAVIPSSERYRPQFTAPNL